MMNRSTKRAMATLMPLIFAVLLGRPPLVGAQSVVTITGTAGDSTQHVLTAPTLSTAAAIGDSTASYRMDWSMGELAVAQGFSPSYKVSLGFWSSCACDCHADPAGCDGAQDVLDVVQTINVAFRGQAAMPDPDGNCSYQTTDVDCSGDTGVIDVVKMINVAFRGMDSSAQFCNPCP